MPLIGFLYLDDRSMLCFAIFISTVIVSIVDFVFNGFRIEQGMLRYQSSFRYRTFSFGVDRSKREVPPFFLKIQEVYMVFCKFYLKNDSNCCFISVQTIQH